MKKLALLLPLFLVACGGSEESTESSNDKQPEKEHVVLTEKPVINPFVPGEGIDVEALNGEIDLNMDISSLSLSDIRILRNAFAARQGYCFMKADLRAIFGTTSWYYQKMEDRWWAEDEGGSSGYPPISYSTEEQAFIEKLKKRESELKAQNFSEQNGRELANLNNIVNLFQLEETNPELMQMLGENGFAIVPNDNIQLFHVYEQNDYQQFPNFVTTDMYMQLFHMYFGYVLRNIEEQKFIPLASEICEAMNIDMMDIATTNPDPSIKEIAGFNATFYSIANSLLVGEKLPIPSEFEAMYQAEMNNVNGASDAISPMMDPYGPEFPYSLFKPRGHYTRTEELKSYFKAMMWLQTAPYCLQDEMQLKRAVLSASVLANSPNHGGETLDKYRSLMDPITFIIGEPDNVSFLNLADLMKESNYDLNSLLTDQATLEAFAEKVKKMADAQNLIRPKEVLGCVDKINFIPQRYLADNEILLHLMDTESKPESKRAYPMGLDVMAGFGSSSAENILLNELQEGKKWDKYEGLLKEVQTKMKSVNWNATVYNKWVESLLNLQKGNEKYPYFMQTPQWQKKDLNASLASWAELKHDAILYAEQPFAAECGGGGPPDPYTVGYVEPNIGYWNTVIELIDLTEQVLENNSLMTDQIKGTTKSMRENAQFLLSASEKELAGKTLSEQEYNQIEFIGSTYEWLTLDLVKQEDEWLSGWDDVKGPDKSVAIIADIFTSNASNNPDKGILHVGTGNVNDIYVVVEIEGYLYLTKGAVFAYHEFHIPLGNRLTDEEWQEMLEKNQAPEMPDWIKEIVVPIEAPATNEKIFYSSGC